MNTYVLLRNKGGKPQGKMIISFIYDVRFYKGVMVKKFNCFKLFLSTVVVLFAAAAMNSSAFAKTFNVSTTQELRQALQEAAGNGQSDVIQLADGIYKTTDDGGGTFTFLDNEDYDLTIQGTSAENVILSGDDTDQVLNFNVINYYRTIHLAKISVQNGKSKNDGGGIYSAENLNIEKCTISGNTSSGRGGGFHNSNGDIAINNSTISGNTSNGGGGGGFYSSYGEMITITNSTISGNTSNGDGGGFSFFIGDYVTITNSTISGNTSSGRGGGFYNSNGDTAITNSTISGNASSGYKGGGGFSSWFGDITVTNSTISGNTSSSYNGGHGGGFSSEEGNNITITNSIFIDNNGINGVYIGSGTDNYILNSIFINNGTYEIVGVSGVVATIYNNYIDKTKIDITSLFENKNIFGGNLDFSDQENGDFHIGKNSVLIDVGTIDISEVTFPKFDMDGNVRVAGGAIDIGPYEYSTTAPTINSFTYSGTAKINSPITFIVNATLADGRTISRYEMDFGDGIYKTVEASTANTYSTRGNYTIWVKVIDNVGEFSEKSLQIFISGPPADVVFVQDITQAMTGNDPESAKNAFYELLSSGLSTDEIVEALYNGTVSAIDAGGTKDFVQQDVDDAYADGYQDGYQAGTNEGPNAEEPPYTGELAENIQSYLILTDNSKPFLLPAGSYIEAYGSSGSNTINITKYARIEFQNFIGSNVINIKEASTDFTVYRSGATVSLNSSSGTLIKIAATQTPQKLKFADGSSELIISGESVLLGNQIIDRTETIINSLNDSSDTSENIF